MTRRKPGKVTVRREGNKVIVTLSGIKAQVEVKGKDYGILPYEETWHLVYEVYAPEGKVIEWGDPGEGEE